MEPIWIVAVAGAAVLVVILLLLSGRRRERVIDMAAPPPTDDEAPAHTAAATDSPSTGAATAGEVLERRGKDDAECGLADWLMADANKALSVDLSSDHTAMTRLAEAALKASAELKSTGRASIELPYLVADASGPKHYKRDVTREEAEIGMIDHGALMVDELLKWRGRDEPTVSLGEWLESAAVDDAGGDTIDDPSTQRLANAAEQAMADLQRSGRAVVDLPDMKKLEGGAFNFRREVDREALSDITGG